MSKQAFYRFNVIPSLRYLINAALLAIVMSVTIVSSTLARQDSVQPLNADHAKATATPSPEPTAQPQADELPPIAPSISLDESPAAAQSRQSASDAALTATETQIASGAAIQQNPQAAFSDGGQRYLVVWMDLTAPGSFKGRLVRADGSFVGSEFLITNRVIGTPERFRLIYNPNDDNFMLIWAERNGLISSETYCVVISCQTFNMPRYNLYAQPLSNTGVRLTAVPGLITNALTIFDTSSAFDIAHNSLANEYVVAWTQPRGGPNLLHNTTYLEHVQAQRADSLGALIGSPVIVTPFTGGEVSAAYSSGSNEVLITYNQYIRTTSALFEMFAQRLEADNLALLGGAINFTDNRPNLQQSAAVAYDNQLDRYLIAWWDNPTDPSGVGHLRAQFYAPGSGAALGSSFIAWESASGMFTTFTRLSYSPLEQRYLIIGRFMGSTQIMARFISPTGSIVPGDDVEITTNGVASRIAARTSGAANPDWMVVWERSSDVYGLLFPQQSTPTPTPTPTAPPAASPTPATPASTLTPSPQNAPAYSTSHYMVTADPAKLELQGCQQARDNKTRGNKAAIIILDFGEPRFQNGQYGAATLLLDGQNHFVTTSDIGSGAKGFLQGYWDCATSDMKLMLALGTVNQGVVGADHGRAWGTMLFNLLDWLFVHPCKGAPSLTCNFSSRFYVGGAMDIEDWNGHGLQTQTTAWLNAYLGASHEQPFYNYGTCENCPSNSPSQPPNTYTNTAYLDYLWYVSYGAAPTVWAIPEIYNSSGSHALQWYNLSRYAAVCTNCPSASQGGYSIWYAGTLTQWQRCKQVPSQCSQGTDNSPAAGWQQLYNALNADPLTLQPTLWHSTDIIWDTP
jgi:hypothetical protein